MWSASAASSMVTRVMVRESGFIVVSQSCSGFISPRPLYRCTYTCLAPPISSSRRSFAASEFT